MGNTKNGYRQGDTVRDQQGHMITSIQIGEPKESTMTYYTHTDIATPLGSTTITLLTDGTAFELRRVDHYFATGNHRTHPPQRIERTERVSARNRALLALRTAETDARRNP